MNNKKNTQSGFKGKTTATRGAGDLNKQGTATHAKQAKKATGYPPNPQMDRDSKMTKNRDE